jgi:hypothetical protein
VVPLSATRPVWLPKGAATTNTNKISGRNILWIRKVQKVSESFFENTAYIKTYSTSYQASVRELISEFETIICRDEFVQGSEAAIAALAERSKNKKAATAPPKPSATEEYRSNAFKLLDDNRGYIGRSRK